MDSARATLEKQEREDLEARLKTRQAVAAPTANHPLATSVANGSVHVSVAVPNGALNAQGAASISPSTAPPPRP
jgi:hypothetical protein